MAAYEMVREIQNLCRNNQMRDVFFDEVETDDPQEYVRSLLPGKAVEMTMDLHDGGGMTIYAACDGMTQKFVFSPLD